MAKQICTNFQYRITKGEILDAGLDYGLVTLACGTNDIDSKKALCRILVRKLTQNEQLSNIGESAVIRRGLGFPGALAGHLATEMLMVCYELDVLPPYELVNLFIKITGSDKLSKKDRRNPAAWNNAANLFASSPEMTNRAAAKKVGVATNTVISWKKDPEFQEAIKIIKSLIDRGIPYKVAGSK